MRQVWAARCCAPRDARTCGHVRPPLPAQTGCAPLHGLQAARDGILSDIRRIVPRCECRAPWSWIRAVRPVPGSAWHNDNETWPTGRQTGPSAHQWLPCWWQAHRRHSSQHRPVRAVRSGETASLRGPNAQSVAGNAVAERQHPAIPPWVRAL